jgi:hypothetical protein
MKTDKYAILVNTCDSFEDCWEPFFKLFSIYWPDYEGKIYLNTEYKDFVYEGLNIIPVKGCGKHQFPKTKRATWSQCLIWALDAIDSDVVLYMQEDYFLKDFVKNGTVEYYAQLIQENNDIHCIHLTDQAMQADTTPGKYENLFLPSPHEKLPITCQAALWQKTVLRSCLRTYENAWQFEMYGSRRELSSPHNIYNVNPQIVRLGKFEIVPYIFTGIIKGRWYEEVVPLFEKHGIPIDYHKRGFVNDAPDDPISKRIKRKFQTFPVWVRYLIEKHVCKPKNR